MPEAAFSKTKIYKKKKKTKDKELVSIKYFKIIVVKAESIIILILPFGNAHPLASKDKQTTIFLTNQNPFVSYNSSGKLNGRAHSIYDANS